MTDWNKHGKIGGTLLENWVEEREIPEQMSLFRTNPTRILKDGHKGILEISSSRVNKDGSAIPLTTTNEDSFTRQVFDDSSKKTIGKKKRMVEAALIEKAKLECRPAPEVRNAKGWISTHHQDFDHSDIYPDIKDLGVMEFTEEELKRYADPITFWSEESKNGKGVTICSIPAPVLASSAEAGEPVYNANGYVKRRLFFKKPDFSTPAREYRGYEVK